VTVESKLERLVGLLDSHAELAIAVSGGIDSMMLAHIAHRYSTVKVQVVHAVSPAVPSEATARVRRHAVLHGWNLRTIEPAELADPSYRSNPVDRCFHCKKRLYGHIRAFVGLPIASGTNLDDLSDYRPGLEAARQHDVRHPFVEAGIAKNDIYALASSHGLDDLAALPAQPCLASRIETGIEVDAAKLQFIEAAEQELAQRLPLARSLRCRITASGVVVECDVVPDGMDRAELERWAEAFCARSGRRFAGIRAYRRGAAFLRDEVA
jgi:pyridinium-3,5-biscarboxylic acid mononucleotide sulfurtransferase